MALLPVAGGVVANGEKPCYRQRAALLTASSLATGGGRRCCQWQEALLPATGEAAADGKKPCYQ
jgi:hypothetical protein